MTRVSVTPEMYRWARERSGVELADLLIRFPKLPDWESLTRQPTLRQLEQYARATLTPIGYLLLPHPIPEPVPIPDFRTMGNREIAHPSPNLLDSIYLCQQRQEWYREYAQEQGLPRAEFVGSLQLSAPAEQAADRIRAWLKFEVAARRNFRTWDDALRQFIAQADAAGIMVMCSGVVGSNNRRGLNPREFRGFALADEFAPLIFINGADTKAAQMFTLAHELAHLWIGQSALSDADIPGSAGNQTERWCNQVAAELLVPLQLFGEALRAGESPDTTMRRLANHFKVSTLVILRRLLDARRISTDDFWLLYRAELERLVALRQASDGGNFYLSQAARISKRFTRALVESTLEGHTLYRDAMRMAGVARMETLHELGRSVGVAT
jgi:Zn-dependent peptidase ImmA (M78 family)